MRELRDKYVEMRAMRLEDAEGRAGDPRARMRALAARFPGALREIDALPMGSIEARIAELERVVRGGEPPRWAVMLAHYHGWMRAALALRRHGGRERSVALTWVRTEYRPGAHEPSVEALSDAVDCLLAPPGGRLNRAVFALLGEEHAASPDSIERELFPAPGAS